MHVVRLSLSTTSGSIHWLPCSDSSLEQSSELSSWRLSVVTSALESEEMQLLQSYPSSMVSSDCALNLGLNLPFLVNFLRLLCSPPKNLSLYCRFRSSRWQLACFLIFLVFSGSANSYFFGPLLFPSSAAASSLTDCLRLSSIFLRLMYCCLRSFFSSFSVFFSSLGYYLTTRLHLGLQPLAKMFLFSWLGSGLAFFFMLFMSSSSSSTWTGCALTLLLLFLSTSMVSESSMLYTGFTLVLECEPSFLSFSILNPSFSLLTTTARSSSSFFRSSFFSFSSCEAQLQRSFLKQALGQARLTACFTAQLAIQIQQNGLAYPRLIIVFLQMLSNQAKLHQLLAKETPTRKEREEVLKLIRNGRYDLPATAFENAFELLKANASGKQRFHHASDLLLSGLELSVGSKLKGYLLKFKQALGDVPYIRKLTALIDFSTSSEPTSDHFGEAIVEDRTNYDSKKQSLTAHKVQYEWDDYVASLNKYLEENPNDVEAWMELGELYTEKSQYLRAIFCYEEVVILNAENDYYFVRLAELYYTDGGKANLATAAKYYSYVVSRNPTNPRALWGLFRTLTAQKDQLDDHDRELLSKVSDSISKLYSKKNPALKLHLAL